MLFGQEWIHGVGTIPSTVHQKLFFWNEEGSFVVVNGDLTPARKKDVEEDG